MSCGSNDPLYPLQADIFYPEISQSAYGSAVKKWSRDTTVYCHFSPAGSKFKEGLTPNVDISMESLLIGRIKTDPRITSIIHQAGTHTEHGYDIYKTANPSRIDIPSFESRSDTGSGLVIIYEYSS